MRGIIKRKITFSFIVVAVCLIVNKSWAVEFAGGTGEPNDPYQIATTKQLIRIGDDPNLLDKYYVLINDIDMDPNLPGGQVFDQPVIAGNFTEFSGCFDGNGHKIKNLTMQNDTADYIGLFGRVISDGSVKNLGLENVSITGKERVGGLAGLSNGTIKNCYANGRVSGGYDCEDIGCLVGMNGGIIIDCRASGNVTGGQESWHIGGLAGFNYGGTIKDCHANISVIVGGYSHRIGGLVGYADAGIIIRCYVTGSVLAGDDSFALGGLVGDKFSGNIESCYSTADITSGDNSDSLGGLVGFSDVAIIINCYATGDISGGGFLGGLVGKMWSGRIRYCYATGRKYYQGEINDYGGLILYSGIDEGTYINQCFWDIEASGASHSDGGIGLTTAQMQDIQTYLDAGWDMVGERENGTTDIWRIPEDGGYPELAVLSEDYQPHILDGAGTTEEPYQIATAEDLGAINHYNLSACYELVSDIDLSGITWDTSPITGFGGSFDGNSHRIMNLTIDTQVHDVTTGLFGEIGGKIWNLGLENVSITVPDNSVDVGGLVGFSSGDIKNCYVTGRISCGDNSYFLGLLAGGNFGNITNCYATGNISVGIDSYAVGGIVGDHYNGTIKKCYAATSISYSDNSCINIGGLLGDNWEGSVVTSFWDVQKSGIKTSDGGLGLTTTEMMDAQVYGLNFWAEDPNWVLDNGKDYPRLAWEGTEGQPIPEPVVDWLNGNGTNDDPFIITTADQLIRISKASVLWDKNYMLISDLDLSGVDIQPIGNNGISVSFNGSFEGNNHIIRNLTFGNNDIWTSYFGFFGHIGNEGQVSHLELKNIQIVTGYPSQYIGGLAGLNDGTITDCNITGSIRGGDYSINFGGLVGANEREITDCYSNVNVLVGNYSRTIGGLVGRNQGIISRCFSTGSVSGLDDTFSLGGLLGGNVYGTINECFAVTSVSGGDKDWGLGGLAGSNGIEGSISDCYAISTITGGNNCSNLGGLAGNNYKGKISYCYTSGNVTSGNDSENLGGFAGNNSEDSVITNCYFLTESEDSGPDNVLGLPLTDEQMKQQTSFADWDFDETWMICEGTDYPRLQWQNIQCDE
jgi:hypothetical protein